MLHATRKTNKKPRKSALVRIHNRPSCARFGHVWRPKNKTRTCTRYMQFLNRFFLHVLERFMKPTCIKSGPKQVVRSGHGSSFPASLVGQYHTSTCTPSGPPTNLRKGIFLTTIKGGAVPETGSSCGEKNLPHGIFAKKYSPSYSYLVLRGGGVGAHA